MVLLPLSVHLVKKVCGLSQGHGSLHDIAKQLHDLPLLPVALAAMISAKRLFEAMDEVHRDG
jgi:hypothetical protein